MGTKYVRVPFEVELAKKITDKSIDGRIVTNLGKEVRIVCFDMLNEKYPIVGLRKDDNYTETALSFNLKGQCLQILEDNDLFLEVPEYMTFKDGDIATFGWEREGGKYYCEWISVMKNIDTDRDEILTDDYVVLCLEFSGEENYFPLAFDCYSDGAKWVRKSTEEEKQKLIDALKESKEPKAKEYLKRFFGIEEKKEYKFKPFDKVLVKDDVKDCWQCSLFSNHVNVNGYKYLTVSGMYKQCIPYNEGTEHLLGTTDNYQ